MFKYPSGNFLSLLVCLCFILCSINVFAQKKRVALVLSGGGAKGIAHVALLKDMERAGIRPDFIVGTSMGSIIGGLYSIGYTADQIEEIVRTIDWDLVVSNNIPLNYISYEEKEYYNRYLLEFPFTEGKLKLPSGLIEGQMLSEVLNHYTWPSMNYKSFDEFPIPFRCVATDVSTGLPIIFEKGSLAEALRASMAIPTAYTAADLDSTLAVDGGVVNNFPADIAKDMGADIIIGMNVTQGFKSAEEIGSMAGILVQMSMLSSNLKLPEQEALCDVYVHPNVDEYSNASFNKYEEILEIGENEVQKHSASLDSIVALIGKREIPEGINVDSGIIIIDSLELEGNKLFGNDLVGSKLGYGVGDTLTKEEVEEGVRRVYGINGFYKVEYRLWAHENHTSYKLKMREKPATTVKSSFHYDNTFSAGITLNITMRDILLKSSRTILAGDISENPRVRFDYYKYIGKRKRVAMNLRYDYIKEQLPIYDRGVKTDVQVNFENTVGFHLITTQSLKSSFMLGIQYESNRFRSEFGGLFPEGMEYADLIHTRLVLSYLKNTLNNRNYPTKGNERYLYLGGVFNNQYSIKYFNPEDTLFFSNVAGQENVLAFNQNDANAYLKDVTPEYYGKFYFRTMDYSVIEKRFQVIPRLVIGATLAGDSLGTIYDEYFVGGFQQVKITDTRFLGLNYGELFTENFGIAGLYFQNVILKNFYLFYGANFLAYNGHIPINDIRVDWNELWNERTMLGYGAELTYKSFIGPISFGITNNTSDGYTRYYFALGFSFNYTD